MNDVQFGQWERDLQIDKHHLDEHVMEQPRLFNEVSQEFAKAVAARDELKDDLKVVEAEVGRKLRNNWNEDDDGKLTEKALAEAVLVHEDRKKAFRKLNDAIFEVERLEALKESYRQRANMLDTFARLFSAGYWQNTSASHARNTTDETTAMNQRARMAEKRSGRPLERRTLRED